MGTKRSIWGDTEWGEGGTLWRSLGNREKHFEGTLGRDKEGYWHCKEEHLGRHWGEMLEDKEKHLGGNTGWGQGETLGRHGGDKHLGTLGRQGEWAGTLGATSGHMEGHFGGMLEVRKGHLRDTRRDIGRNIRGQGETLEETLRGHQGEKGENWVQNRLSSSTPQLNASAPPPLPSLLPARCFGDTSSALACVWWGSQVTSCPLFSGGNTSHSEGMEQGHRVATISHPFQAGQAVSCS